MKKTDLWSKEEFIKNYKELKSSRKMAQLYNCSRKIITNYAKEIGYDYSQNKEIKITNIPVEEVYRLYCQTHNAVEVGKIYNCSGTAVRNYLKKNNYKLVHYDNL